MELFAWLAIGLLAGVAASLAARRADRGRGRVLGAAGASGASGDDDRACIEAGIRALFPGGSAPA